MRNACKLRNVINLPKAPETWSKDEISRYFDVLPKNYRTQRSIPETWRLFHVICEDNVIRAFTAYRSGDNKGSVTYLNKRVRGWVETTEYASFFFGDDIMGNGIIPFAHQSKILRYKLEQIESSSRS